MIFRDLGAKWESIRELLGLAEAIVTIDTSAESARRAVRLMGAVAHCLEIIGGALLSFDPPRQERALTRAEAILGQATADAWREGQAMSWEEAVAYALESCDTEQLALVERSVSGTGSEL